MNPCERLLGAHIAVGGGGRVAYLDEELGEVTYARLYLAVRRYAGMLRDRGVPPGTRGLVVADDSVATVVAILGLWAHRCVPVPLSPLLTDAELGFVADDCAAGFAHVDGPARRRDDLAALFRSSPTCTGDEARELVRSGRPDAGPAPAAWRPEREILIQYTSGSTGVPKGVLHGTAGLEAVLAGFGRTLGLRPDDTVLSTAKLSFGYGFGNSLLFPLAARARAVLLAGPVDAHRLSVALRERRPTVLFSVPRMYHALAELAGRGGGPEVRALRLAVSAGEHLPAELQRRFERAYGVPLVNGLGATEVLHIVLAAPPGGTARGSIGPAVPGVRVSVRDADGVEVPDGEEGRLHIAGPTVAPGYLSRPEQTARTFADGGAYTGDVVRRNEVGDIRYVCRADDLLNVGGYKVSPLEIEAVVRRTPEVADCAVVGGTDPTGLDEAVAYVVAAPGADADAVRRAVGRAVREQLPPFKRPSRIETLAALPTTSTGKLARFKLRGAPGMARVATTVLNPDGDRTLVCLPYAGGTAHAYTRLVQALRDAAAGPAWRVVTGEAGYPPGTTVASAADAWWAAVRAELRPGTVLFGHSVGAAIVAEIARRHADRLDGVHVVVSAPPMRRSHPVFDAGEEPGDGSGNDAGGGGGGGRLLDTLHDAGLLPPLGLSPDELRRLVVPRFVNDLRPLRGGWRAGAPGVPVHVLVGATDPVCSPADMAAVLDEWPVAGLHVVEGGHYFCVERADRVAVLLEEIARGNAPGAGGAPTPVAVVRH
jgi:acyl-coenzyme A synthetase/AMP-(fatty) acid ligase/surfactin synthase thioesterase subunit